MSVDVNPWAILVAALISVLLMCLVAGSLFLRYDDMRMAWRAALLLKDGELSRGWPLRLLIRVAAPWFVLTAAALVLVGAVFGVMEQPPRVPCRLAEVSRLETLRRPGKELSLSVCRDEVGMCVHVAGIGMPKQLLLVDCGEDGIVIRRAKEILERYSSVSNLTERRFDGRREIMCTLSAASPGSARFDEIITALYIELFGCSGEDGVTISVFSEPGFRRYRVFRSFGNG